MITDDRDPKVWKVLAKDLYGKLFADRVYITQRLFNFCTYHIPNSRMSLCGCGGGGGWPRPCRGGR